MAERAKEAITGIDSKTPIEPGETREITATPSVGQRVGRLFIANVRGEPCVTCGHVPELSPWLIEKAYVIHGDDEREPLFLATSGVPGSLFGPGSPGTVLSPVPLRKDECLVLRVLNTDLRPHRFLGASIGMPLEGTAAKPRLRGDGDEVAIDVDSVTLIAEGDTAAIHVEIKEPAVLEWVAPPEGGDTWMMNSVIFGDGHEVHAPWQNEDGSKPMLSKPFALGRVAVYPKTHPRDRISVTITNKGPARRFQAKLVGHAEKAKC